MWNACRREDRNGDHHGLDLGEGLEVGVLDVTSALTLFSVGIEPVFEDGHWAGGRGGRGDKRGELG